MAISIDSLIKALRRSPDLREHDEAIKRFVSAGDFDKAAALARATEDRWNLGIKPRLLEAVYDRVVRALALQDHPDAAAAAVHLSFSPRRRSLQRARPDTLIARELAGLLAVGQDAKTLTDWLAAPHLALSEDLLACWVQELLLRGHDFSDEPSANALWSQLHRSRHPLAALPLHLHPVEEELHTWIPHHGEGGSCVALPFGPSTGGQSQSVANMDAEITELPMDVRASAVVTNWEEESAGRIETRRLRFDRPLSPKNIDTGLFSTFPLTCLQGANAEEVRVHPLPVKQALGVLFAASATGGAYSSGRHGAYGRLELWQSVAGLLGAPSINVEALAAEASRWSWFSFDATSAWFWQVAWDLGIATLAPDGQDLSILAATDTD